MEQLLLVQDLVKQYPGNEGVDNIGFTVERGEIVGLLGANGAGKTTTLRCIAGLYKPQKGTITIDGNKAGSEQAQRLLSFIPDSPSLYPMLTVAEHLQFKAKAFRIPPKKLEEAVLLALKEVNLESYANRPAGNLSRGQKQRVVLAAAVIQQADLYLFDEPTVGLDIPSKEWLAQWLLKNRANNKSIIVSSHSLEFVMETAQRVILIKKGRIVAESMVPSDEEQRLLWKKEVIGQLGGHLPDD
ncbi:ABC-2 type transport system ATP-binding protein [Paenibacillus algorifonticola]|uniref:ABC-2 type transport system ATP-binding protein n=1 Tax=Paenibacillus algorifonticola TaxID=684063 RepID=A0A1I2IKW9_9BACL|nr:ABC transporter ATP-binding protein [Paenibacillus algorifonticola]SFF42330.1 ABC-2 type transport system ATP-binding protein [Paenibacillus algorifonticola]